MAKKKSRTRKLVIGCGGAIVLLLLCVVVITLLPEADEGADSLALGEAPETPAPSASLLPPQTEPTLDPWGQLEADIKAELLGPKTYAFSFDPESGVILVRYVLAPNFGVPESAVNRILKVIGPRDLEYTQLMLIELVEVRDTLGNIEVREVLRATYSHDTFRQVAWENFASYELLPIVDWADSFERFPRD